MGRYREPRLKKMRALGTVLPGLGTGDLERRPYPPGQHGQRRRKISEYGLRLLEKQKLVFNYGVSEKQLRAIVVSARKMQGVTGENILGLLDLQCRWPGPTRFGDTIHVVLTISDCTPTSKPGRGVVTMTREVVNQRDETVMVSTWKLLVRAKDAAPA